MSGTDPRDEDKDDEAARDSEPPARDSEPPEDEDAPRKAKAGRPGKLGKKARREEEARLARQSAMTRAIVVGVLALAAGVAGGWFGHIEQAKAKIRAESGPAPAGSASGACGAWEKKICSGSGEQSAACMQAKGATGLLTPTTCEVALEAVPATLAKVKAERVPCDNLTSKLCKDLPPDSQTCTMIKERTPSFPADKCKEMLKNYDQVLAEVRQLDQNPMPMGMPGHGGPPPGHGGPPPGQPPH
jgi:hypothetical protein